MEHSGRLQDLRSQLATSASTAGKRWSLMSIGSKLGEDGMLESLDAVIIGSSSPVVHPMHVHFDVTKSHSSVIPADLFVN